MLQSECLFTVVPFFYVLLCAVLVLFLFTYKGVETGLFAVAAFYNSTVLGECMKEHYFGNKTSLSYIIVTKCYKYLKD